MRNFEERKEEIFRRSEKRIAQRKKNIRRTIVTCVPLVLCVSALAGYLTLGSNMEKAAAPESPWYGMVMDSAANGSGLLYSEDNVPVLPESAPEKSDGAWVPESMQTVQDGMALELHRGGKVYSYTETEILKMFQTILGGNSSPNVAASAQDSDNTHGYSSHPGQIIDDEPYLLKLTQADGTEVWYTLRGNRLTRQDGQTYMLTDDQAKILHKLMEVKWP